MTKQEQIDAAVQSLTASAANIQQDLVNLKEQIASGTVSDESIAKLETLTTAFQTIADSTEDNPATGEQEA